MAIAKKVPTIEEAFEGKDWCLAPTWGALAKRLGL